MTNLFQCAIGPVQDFIASARRSRDLWYGSWLLSELAKAAARALVDSNSRLIFPTALKPSDLDPGSTFNVPNKVVAIADIAPDSVGAAVEMAVRKRLLDLRKIAFAAVGDQGQFKYGLAEAQVDDLPEIYWVGVEFDGTDADYERARDVAERTMNARKATRSFDSFKGEPFPKSSLDGVRESVINETAYPKPGANDAEKEAKAKKIYQNFKARPVERLSGVDILKRLGNDKPFPSTSHMAALPFLCYVDRAGKAGNRDALLVAIRAMLKAQEVSSDESDGALVYSSRLAEWIPSRTKLETVTQAQEKLLHAYAGETRPGSYFALLLADGDNMGAAINNQMTIQAHQVLSKTLSQFANDVDGIVQGHEGVLIYSGGDDVLAYLPLHRALACANELAEAFASKMDGFITKEGKSPTLSTGIVVAHHLEPLADTLEVARAAERAAKSVEGKNALAITVSKRSGVDRTIKGKRAELMKRLTTMIGWRRNGDISAGTPYELQRLHQVLGDSAALQDALTKEALRIVERKRQSGGTAMSKEKQDATLNEFVQWLSADNISLLEVAHEMIIANEFASALDMACGENEECEPE
ncbi:MAG: type III-B CRISPR-associated protein Cas10/Cmr2 [Caldilineaceae bacterium]